MNHINMAHVQGNVDLHYWFYCSEVSIFQLFLHFKCHLSDLILNLYLRNFVPICHTHELSQFSKFEEKIWYYATFLQIT